MWEVCSNCDTPKLIDIFGHHTPFHLLFIFQYIAPVTFFIGILTLFPLPNFHRDDGSTMAMKTLKRVQKGWGQGNLSYFQAQKNDFLDDLDAAI